MPPFSRSSTLPARSLPAILLCAALLLTSFPFAAADHMQSGGGRVVSFDHRGGNEWWVEVFLGGQDGGLAERVEAMDTNGYWVPLTKRSWGNWAASFHIEPGHLVMFRASWSGGAQVDSCWFTHPGGAEQCNVAPPFWAQFTLVTGNEWWEQAQVTPSGDSLGSVAVRMNTGPWQALQLQSWGVRAYAGSYRAPEGTIVQFRAVSSHGVESLSECYHWIPPEGSHGETAQVVPCSQPPPRPFTATFSNVKGNPWWVEAKVTGSRPVDGADARVEQGPWRPLTLRSWGAWAASFQIPDGSYVELRARSGVDSFVAPGSWVWPSVTPVLAWPHEGSFVRYYLDHHTGAPDGSYSQSNNGTLRLTYGSGAWSGRCDITTGEYWAHNETQRTREWSAAVTLVPPRMPTAPSVNATLEMPTLVPTGNSEFAPSCDGRHETVVVAPMRSHLTRLTDANGRALTPTEWYAQEPDDRSEYQSQFGFWEPHLGLLTDWGHGALNSGSYGGHLIDTDAPIR